jgi:anti-sigma regulatory factor (Ser/Thr protein kinase)
VSDTGGFRHEALLYAGLDGFLDAVLPFVNEARACEEPILVVVDGEKIARLREAVADESEGVEFADMAAVGANPARLIPAWRDFVSDRSAPGRRVRGVGEPIGPERSGAALTECHRHESLLNLAFADAEDFWLLCPYDVSAVDSSVLAEAERTHPYVLAAGVERPSAGYPGLEALAVPFADPLPEAPADVPELRFDRGSLDALRNAVARRAARAGATPPQVEDLILAVHEVATNSVRHGGGLGLLRIWEEGDTLVCDIRDAGRLVDPMAGRVRPPSGRFGGYGLWLANQLCDLVQVRTFDAGTVVRLHMRIRERSVMTPSAAHAERR